MRKKNLLLIINPNASKGKGKARAKQIAAMFEAKGVVCTVAYTSGIGHATKLAKSGAENGFDVIVAAGGDGTVNEVINGIMQSGRNRSVKMGIIPMGRGNDFAWVAGIPTKMEEAVDRIVQTEGRPCDVGFCKGSGKEKGLYFLNGMGFGFESAVNFKARDYKHINGMASYILAFVHILFNPPKGYDLTINIDGEEKSLQCQQISVNNGRRMGSSFLLTPRAKIDDGLLDVMHTNNIAKGFGLIGLAIKFLRGAVLKDKEAFTYCNAHTVVIDCKDKVVEAHADGEEYTRKGNHFEIQILPSAINLF